MSSNEYDEQLIENMQNVKALNSLASYDYLSILDQNSGQYSSNQVQFDTLSFANNNRKMIWSEGYVQIPMVVGLEPTTSAELIQAGGETTAAADYAAAVANLRHGLAFKAAGSVSIIDSVLVYLNGKGMTNNSRGQSVMSHLRNLLNFSTNKRDTYGPSILFFPDVAGGSTTSGASPSVKLIGNDTLPTSPQFNGGMATRASWLSHSNVETMTPLGTITSLNLNYNALTAGVAVALNVAMVWHLSITVRLSDIHDCFKVMDFPVSNIHAQIYLNVNQGRVDIAAGNSNQARHVASTNLTGSSCPFNVTYYGDLAAAFSAPAAGATNRAYTLSFKIGKGLKLINQADVGAQENSCRLYIPAVTLEPSVELEMLRFPRRVVKYKDHQIFTLIGIDPSGPINWSVTNGISNLKRLFFIPYMSGKATIGGISPVQSPKCVEPYSGTQGCLFDNIQLILNGKNYYSNSINNNYEQYLHNTNTETLNAGQTDEIAAGLYSSEDFRHNPMYVFDVARNPDIASPDVSVSIQLIAKNMSPFAIDVHCYAEFENTFEIERAGGNVMIN
jgi:hypothetical protein